MLKYLTDKETYKSVAVNPKTVLYVADTGHGPKIIFVDGSYIVVTERYFDVVAHLNERD